MPDVPKVRPKIARGRDLKKKKYRLLQILPGEWFKVRRCDLTTLFLEGAVPTPLLNAVDKIQEMRTKMGREEGGVAGALNAITQDERDSFLELQRRIAVAVTVAPKLTHSKKQSLADEDLLWVGGISDVPEDHASKQDGDVAPDSLWMLWKYVTGEAGINVMDDVDAIEFHSSESDVADSAVRDGDGVRSSAVDVVPLSDAVPHAPPEIEFIGNG